MGVSWIIPPPNITPRPQYLNKLRGILRKSSKIYLLRTKTEGVYTKFTCYFFYFNFVAIHFLMKDERIIMDIGYTWKWLP